MFYQNYIFLTAKKTNMNGTILSQIVWVMTLAHYRLLKVAEMCQKSQK